MKKANTFIVLTLLFLSCKSKNPEIPKPEQHVSSNEALVHAVDSIILSNPNSIKVSGRFIKQEEINGKLYLYMKNLDDSLIVLNDPLPLDSKDIARLRKSDNNISVIYSKEDSTISSIAAVYDK